MSLATARLLQAYYIYIYRLLVIGLVCNYWYRRSAAA